MSKKEILLQINFNHEDYVHSVGFPVDVLEEINNFEILKSYYQDRYSHLPISIYCLFVIGMTITIRKKNRTDNIDGVIQVFLQALSYTYQNFPKLLDDPILFSDEDGCKVDVTEEQGRYIERVDKTSKGKIYSEIQTKNDGSIQRCKKLYVI